MYPGQTVLLACRISRSAFSGERVFRVETVGGLEHVGVAPVDYCLKADQSPVGQDEPVKGHPIPGFVEARVIRNGGGEAEVALPDGEAIIVPASVDRIPFVRKESKEYVPLGS